ncbi:hypothetical protein HYU07_00770 [Candidatus Woesearchaeota archaeon]|nr:hypothetical protein [Candidatus Woesearchaeota archaeon]
MDLITESFKRLCPEKEPGFSPSLKYSGRFSGYNANIRFNKLSNKLEISLSKKWKKIDDEIQIGLVQSLLLKIFKDKKNTANINMYNIFMKRIHIAIPKVYSDPALDESFNRVNEKYFFSLIEKPNLKWGSHSKAKLGCYDYGSDTITISRVFENNIDLLDYIMYHEALHKKHKFENRNGRNYSHTKDFRLKETEFENAKIIENKISRLIARRRVFDFIGF